VGVGRCAGKRVWQSIALWFGLFALTIQGLAPLCMAGGQGAAGANAVVICTSHGFKTVQLDSSGNAVPNTPAPDHASCFFCLGCPMGAGFTAPTVAALPAPVSVASDNTLSPDAPRAAYAAHRPYASRAPPPARETITA
jgi:hypothetical protein